MQKQIKLFLSIMLISSIQLNADTKTGPFFSIRSQSQNAARNIAGWQQRMNVNGQGKTYSHFNITPGYSRSFRPNDITKFLFGDNLINENSIRVSGSTATGQAAPNKQHDLDDWFADYFGLPSNFISTVTFKPEITNVVVDFNGIISLDDIVESAFLEFHVPICRCEADLKLRESKKTPGSSGLINGDMIGLSGNGTPPGRETLPNNFEEAIKGTTIFGDMNNPLKYGKIDGKQKKTRLSDIHINAGYTIFQTNRSHLAVKLCLAIPTGSAITSEYLFEPIVGNGKHWELGAGINTHSILLTSSNENISFGVYADAKITHMFNARQKRTFELKNKLNSQYMLISELGPNDGLLFHTFNVGIENDDAGIPSPYQYQGKLFPLGNKTTLNCDTRIAIQADAAIKFAFVWGGFAFDVGYNIWAKTKEKICIKEEIEKNKYALKGSAHMYGFAETTNTVAGAPPVTDQQAIALAPTSSNATIKDGLDKFINVSANINGSIDSRRPARSHPNAIVNRRIDRNPTDIQTGTSSTPIFIKQSDLDDSDRPAQITHKVFGYMSYTWKNRDTWVPFIGVGAEGEFDARKKENRTAIAQWGVWGKAGISFN